MLCLCVSMEAFQQSQISFKLGHLSSSWHFKTSGVGRRGHSGLVDHDQSDCFCFCFSAEIEESGENTVELSLCVYFDLEVCLPDIQTCAAAHRVSWLFNGCCQHAGRLTLHQRIRQNCF